MTMNPPTTGVANTTDIIYDPTELKSKERL